MKMGKVRSGFRAKTLEGYPPHPHSKITISSSSSSGAKKNRLQGKRRNVTVVFCTTLWANTGSMQAHGSDRRSFKFRKAIVANTGAWPVAPSRFRPRHSKKVLSMIRQPQNYYLMKKAKPVDGA